MMVVKQRQQFGWWWRGLVEGYEVGGGDGVEGGGGEGDGKDGGEGSWRV